VTYQEAVLDVHAPHHPIGGWKDFFVHLVTITVGLLIAVGIEGCVERHREHTLVQEARETMREEIQHNSDEMTGTLVSVKKQRATMEKNIETLTRIQENPGNKDVQKDASIAADYSMVGLRDTAWKTAQTTGAMGFMPYAEAQRYSDVYGAQKDFLDQQAKIMEDEAQFFGVMAKTNFGHGDVVTEEQATLALEQFGVWNAHLLYLDMMAQLTAGTDKAFLEGKAAPTDIHEEIHRK
jgi:hypothetical protein